MTRAAIALLAVLTALAGVLGGYWWGRTDGAAVAKARQAAQVVADMEQLLDKHAGLAAQSNAASAALRKAAAHRGEVDRRTTKELKDALGKTADSRVDCRFDAGVMQHLQAARDRASVSAAGGGDGAVPGAARHAGQ